MRNFFADEIVDQVECGCTRDYFGEFDSDDCRYEKAVEIIRDLLSEYTDLTCRVPQCVTDAKKFLAELERK